jgi:hypothetical protein
MINLDDYIDASLMVSDTVKVDRLTLCIECDNYDNAICKKCDCLAGLMAAYTFKTCPIGNWV